MYKIIFIHLSEGAVSVNFLKTAFSFGLVSFSAFSGSAALCSELEFLSGSEQQNVLYMEQNGLTLIGESSEELLESRPQLVREEYLQQYNISFKVIKRNEIIAVVVPDDFIMMNCAAFEGRSGDGADRGRSTSSACSWQSRTLSTAGGAATGGAIGAAIGQRVAGKNGAEILGAAGAAVGGALGYKVQDQQCKESERQRERENNSCEGNYGGRRSCDSKGDR